MTKAALPMTETAEMTEMTEITGLDPAASRAAAAPEAEGAQLPASYAAPRPAQPPRPPLPLLAPYFGVVAAMLCMLIGAWLLLAPYAFDYRHAAAKVPQTTTVDLATGAAVFALAAMTAALFAGCIARRLQAGRPQAVPVEPAPVESGRPDEAASAEAPPAEEGSLEEFAAYEAFEAAQEPEPEPVLAPPIEESFSYEPHKPPLADPVPPQSAEPGPRSAPEEPGTALRDLLAPLVAALTADLNSRERERDYGYGAGYSASRSQVPSASGGRGSDE